MATHCRLFERSEATRSAVWYREILEADEPPVLDRVQVPKAFLGDPAPLRIVITVTIDPDDAFCEVSSR